MVVATHDVEFASEFAERVVLLGDGVVIADGRMEDVLSGGWYFATEVARVLDLPGVVTPEQGALALAGVGDLTSHSEANAPHPEERAGVSWQLVSFLIVVGVIVAGFAWYERSRPPSQIVALVAALAALAIAGRIAFAAFPNVKPTTDIVIFAGYALGPAPGFAVGRSPAWSPTSGSGRGRGRRGRWRAGDSAASSARCWPWGCGTPAATRWRWSAGWPRSATGRCRTSR